MVVTLKHADKSIFYFGSPLTARCACRKQHLGSAGLHHTVALISEVRSSETAHYNQHSTAFT
jgi:hypothetical protein